MTSVDAALSGVTRLGFDTSPFIYFVERHPAYSSLMHEVFRRVSAGQPSGQTSIVTLVETLTHPKRHGNARLEAHYRAMLLSSRNFTMFDVHARIAEGAADLRARYNLRTPDALQLAAASHGGCEAFLTNDTGLRRVTELRVLVLDELTL